MRMTDVPLFPLQTVLFPQMILPLHIFEMRYRLMISECLKTEQAFGVILLQDGDEVQETPQATQPAQPCQVGTLAKITGVVKLEDGSMLLTTVGTERFRLLEYYTHKPYMTGDIDLWPDMAFDASQAQAEVSQVRSAFETYLRVLMELAGKQVEGLDIPFEPAELSYLVPNWLHISTNDKQRLLEAPDPQTRLQAERVILTEEARFLTMIKQKADEEALFEQSGSPKLDWEKRAKYDITSNFSNN